MKVYIKGKLSDYIGGGIVCVHGLYDGKCSCADKWKDQPVVPLVKLKSIISNEKI